jgi:hypothetical protein
MRDCDCNLECLNRVSSFATAIRQSVSLEGDAGVASRRGTVDDLLTWLWAQTAGSAPVLGKFREGFGKCGYGRRAESMFLKAVDTPRRHFLSNSVTTETTMAPYGMNVFSGFFVKKPHLTSRLDLVTRS